ncbi:MAG: hypothetical protein K5985_11570 [Lachnospiraceae bacterium]|nr:hypothetical protein [Lachnospiraceae bacterium]
MNQEITVLAVQPIAMAYSAQKEKKEKAKNNRKMQGKRKEPVVLSEVQAYYIPGETSLTHYPTYGKDYLIR